MTPAARLQAAIDVLSHWFDGAAAEKALTNWARGARYAGSKDRAAVRDIVFDCLRKRLFFQKSFAVPDTPRGLVVAHAALTHSRMEQLFVEGGFGPAPLTPDERTALQTPGQLAPEVFRTECPCWMAEEIERSLGSNLEQVVEIMRNRADVHLRVNQAKTDLQTAQASLAEHGIDTQPHPLAGSALRVLTNPRRIAMSPPFLNGEVELQDAASQAVVEQTLKMIGKPLTVLDYCAGGGGKSLAFAAEAGVEVFATDVDTKRMKDIPTRAQRAGAKIKVLDIKAAAKSAPFDLVFCDVPCTGSGAWRRNPEGKWRMTPKRASEIRQAQQDVLEEASKLVGPTGLLAYATCSIFQSENETQVKRFADANPDWSCTYERRFSPIEGGDGFYLAHLSRK